MPDGTIPTVVINPIDPVTGLPTGDIDVTSLALEASFTRRLNGIDTATGRFAMKDFPGTIGAYFKIYLQNDILGTTPILYHHGRILNMEVTGNEDFGYVVVNSSGPLELWKWRPVRDDDGDFSKPDIIDTYQYAPTIIQAMFNNSDCTGNAGPLTPPADCEGPLRMFINSVAGGTEPLLGAPTDWPMTMAELANLLISTGQLDIVVTPIEFTGVNDDYGQLDLYNGDYGNDLQTDVRFEYGTGLRNVRAFRWNQDFGQGCNKLWYYLGPRVETADDPAGDQHWRANITGTDYAFDSDALHTGPWVISTGYVAADMATHGGNKWVCILAHTASAANEPGVGASWPAVWALWRVPPGGRLSPPASATSNTIGVARAFSQTYWDVRMDIRIYDARGDEALVGRELYRRLWQEEQYLRSQPVNLVHVTPTRDTDIGAFDIGDIVTVVLASDVAGGISGGQRIYQYSVSWDTESVPALSELQVSSDAEALT